MLSKSKAQTQKIAIRLARKILKANRPERSRRATVIALTGDLGAGKTAFTQGFIKSLGVKTHIPSPTFVIFRRYPINFKLRREAVGVPTKALGFKNAFHFDLYRIQKSKEIIDLDFRKIIKNPENIVLIEWPEAIAKFLPKDTIWVKLSHGGQANERVVKIVEN